jgi:hypothetical protein
LIAFPPYVASTISEILPCDDRGFVNPDLGCRQIEGNPDICAFGDAADFPVRRSANPGRRDLACAGGRPQSDGSSNAE